MPSPVELSQAPMHVLSFPPELPELDNMEAIVDAIPFARMEDMGTGIIWGRTVCEMQVVSQKRICVVISPQTGEVLWLVRPSDIVIH